MAAKRSGLKSFKSGRKPDQPAKALTKALKFRRARESSEAPPAGLQKTREALLEAAIRLFSEKGYAATTVKDISDAAGVNISLVSYHYQGKEGLYRACMTKFGESQLAMIDRLLRAPASVEEFQIRLQMFAEELLSDLQRDCRLFQILQQEMDAGLPLAEDVFRETFLKIHETLKAFFKVAQQRRFIRSDIDIRVAVGHLVGSIMFFVRSDRIGERFLGLSLRDPKYFQRVKQSILQLFLNGIANPDISNNANESERSVNKAEAKQS